MINQLSHLLMHAGMITVFVITMMLIIDMVNVKTDGKLQERLKKAWFGQHLLGAILGIVPGCLGTFTIVSMYMHRILRIGAVVTTMIATSGDEAFVMFALFPRQALYLTLLLFVVGMVSGMLTDFFLGRMGPPKGCCDTEFAVHGHHSNEKLAFSNIKSKITSITLPFLVLLSVALLFSFTTLWQMIHKGVNIENSIWLTVMLTLLGVTLFSTPHFLRQHLWEHIAKKHAPKVFLWTFGSLLFIAILKRYQLEGQISSSPWILLLLAGLIGFIPDSGPHLLFVMLFFQGVIPFSVLAASSISQDGHGAIPLLAHSRKDFFFVKGINLGVGLLVGAVLLLLGT